VGGLKTLSSPRNTIPPNANTAEQQNTPITQAASALQAALGKEHQQQWQFSASNGCY
jgi:hypothetical protein